MLALPSSFMNVFSSEVVQVRIGLLPRIQCQPCSRSTKRKSSICQFPWQPGVLTKAWRVHMSVVRVAGHVR